MEYATLSGPQAKEKLRKQQNVRQAQQARQRVERQSEQSRRQAQQADLDYRIAQYNLSK